MLTPIQIAAFQRDGVLILRQAIPPAERQRLHAAASAIRAQAERELPAGLRFAPRRDQAGPRDADHTWGINEITRPGLYDPTLLNAIALPAIQGALAALLDQPRAWGQKMLWAPRACDYDLHWHRDIDHGFDPVLAHKPAANDHIQFNAALGSDPSFRVVPGSHRRALTTAEWTALHADRWGAMPGEIHVPLDPGDILLMDAHALHRGAVPAGNDRLTLHFSFQADWVPLWPWGDADHFAWITSDAFIATLDPCVQPYYRRLAAKPHAIDQHGWLITHAREQGWTPPADWVQPRKGYAA